MCSLCLSFSFGFILFSTCPPPPPVTITVTRKMITLFISIFRFGYVVSWWQWVGVGCAFVGV